VWVKLTACTARQRSVASSSAPRRRHRPPRSRSQQLTSAELISLAKEVVAAAARGANFTPPLDEDQLAFHDAVATNESAVDVMGEGGPCRYRSRVGRGHAARHPHRWTGRDDVRAKLRTSIKRLLVNHGYPPDQRVEAIKLVMEQMESMAPRYAQRRQQLQRSA
jgi:type I restriction enzyme R subunit